MGELITTIASIITIVTFAQKVQDNEMDVYINGNQVAETTPAQIIKEKRDQTFFLLTAFLLFLAMVVLIMIH